MSFFNKTFRSILGLSNSENQPTSGRRYPPSPGGLTLISTTAGIASPATVLESVTLKPTPSATTAGKKITIRTDDMHDSIAGCFRPVDSIAGCFKPVDLAGDVRARLDRYATLTECIGFESCDLTAAQVSSVPLTAGARKRETMRREEVMVGGKNEREISPPVMSSLNENGRPRFNLEKMRKDGRLLIYKVRNDRPEIVRTVFPEEDRIKIRLIGF